MKERLRYRRRRRRWRLPDGPWFPWSREFRWDLMPWNTPRDEVELRARSRRELALLLEASGATVGRVARSAGYELNASACRAGTRQPGGRSLTVLYEAHPAEFNARFPHLEAVSDKAPCVDLWLEWLPDAGELEVHGEGLPWIPGLPGSVAPEGAAALEPVTDGVSLRRTLELYAREIRRVFRLDDTELP